MNISKFKRARPTSTKCLTDEFYEEARKIAELKNMTDKEISNIVLQFHKLVAEDLFNTYEGIELPQQLGYLIAVRVKQDTPTVGINQQASLKAGKKIKYRNWETDGYVGKIVYRKHQHLENKYGVGKEYRFHMSQEHRRHFAKLFRENYQRFFNITKR